MSTILSRWRARRAIRVGLLARARASVVYWGRRAGSAHGRAMLAEARARYALRQRQVAEADRVIARHTHAGITTMSNAGVALVAGFEGFRSAPYRDPVGIWTIGYGETQGIGPGSAPWSRTYALSRLRIRLNRDFLGPVLAVCKASGFNPTQHQADALGSFAYNLGTGPFGSGHTMGDAIRSRDVARIANAFLIYDKAGGRTLPGLTSRRRAERALFLKDY